MKKPQWIVIAVAVVLTGSLFLFGRTTPKKKTANAPAETEVHGPGDGHNHAPVANVTIDTVLFYYKKEMPASLRSRAEALETSLSGTGSGGDAHIFHQLSKFWGDTARAFEPYAWYEAEAARLENSEKSLTFAARLFLDNLQTGEQSPGWIKWKALQAKDLFERSLKINPGNDSARVGIGACYLFGGISEMPMEGIQKIREVVEKDSTNVYAQLMLAKGAIFSGQYDKAVTRLQTVHQLAPEEMEATLLLGDVYERTGEKQNAIIWYKESLKLTKQAGLKKAIEERIAALQ